jgi:hypothetical protein
MAVPGEELLKHVREELTRADAKSSLLLSAVGVAIGALIGGLLAGDWSPFELGNAVEWLWWLGVATATVAIFKLACAVYPVTVIEGRVPPPFPAYFKDVLSYESVESLQAALERGGGEGASFVADQLMSISKIVDRKYAAIQMAMRLLGVAAGCCTAAVLVDALAG